MTTSRTTALALAAVIALAFAAILVGGQTFGDAGWLASVAPARIAAGRAISDGALPGWWDGAGFGVPLLADASHGALYPPTWLAAAGERWLDLIAIAHLWLFAFGTAQLARRLGADAAGALVAGAAAGLAGIATGALVSGVLFSLAWAPLMVWAALAVADAAAGPQRSPAPDDDERPARLRATTDDARPARLRAATDDDARPARLRATTDDARPARLCAATDDARRARARAAIGLALATAASAFGGAPGATGWAAVAALALVAIDVRPSSSAARTLGWVAGALALGALAAGVQLVPALLHVVGGQAAGAPAVLPRARLVALIAPGAAPAIGWPSLAGGAAIIALAALAPVRARAAALALVLAGLWSPAAAAVAWALVAALAGVGAVALAARPPSRADLLRALTVVGGLAVALATAAVLRYRLAAAIDRAGLDGAALIEHGLARGALAVVFAAAAVAVALDAGRRRSPTLAAAAGLIAVAEVALAGHAAVPRMTRPGRPALAIAGGPGVTRVFRPSRPPAAGADLEDDLARLAGAAGAPWGQAAVPATDPARLAGEDRLATATAAVAMRLLDRYAVARAIVPSTVATPAGLAELAHRGDEALVALAAARPPAFWTSRWRRASDDETLAALSPPPGEPAAPLPLVHLALGGASAGELHDDGSPLHPCRLDRDGPGRVTLGCDVTADGYAVLLDAWAPGWSATVDGHAATVERADLIARAVAVPAGAHQIALRYRPPGLRLGALISALAALNLALAGWLARRERARA